ncbi:hypothetical protein [Zunongwangia sp.]|uniref:hypothetical protein n=1 Tax=Zunongwangia sp. TaxID=1965325 RepID=UPI003AA80A77
MEILIKTQKQIQDFEFLYYYSDNNIKSFFDLKSKSNSQLDQDLFVLFETNFKQNGYFVEFGATNGIAHSNTHLLEIDFGWKGILAEPSKY